MKLFHGAPERPAVEFQFDPKPDITAYELAALMKFIVNKRSYKHMRYMVDHLPPELRRHIREF